MFVRIQLHWCTHHKELHNSPICSNMKIQSCKNNTDILLDWVLEGETVEGPESVQELVMGQVLVLVLERELGLVLVLEEGLDVEQVLAQEEAKALVLARVTA